jgi:hypothetical protein
MLTNRNNLGLAVRSLPERDQPPAPTQPATSIAPLITKRDIATVLRVDIRTVNRMLAENRLPAPTLRIGRSARWRIESVLALIEKGGQL